MASAEQTPSPEESPSPSIDQLISSLGSALAALPPSEGLAVCRKVQRIAGAWEKNFRDAMEQQAAAPLSGPELARHQKLWDGLVAAVSPLPDDGRQGDVVRCGRTPDGKVWLMAHLNEERKVVLLELDIFYKGGSSTLRITEEGIEYFDTRHPEQERHWKPFRFDMDLGLRGPTPEQALKRIREQNLVRVRASQFP